MKNELKEKQGIKIKNFIGLGISVLVFSIILVIFPDKSPAVISASLSYFKEMMVILPSILLLMGLFMVWISKDVVLKYLGKSSGIKGVFVSLMFTTDRLEKICSQI